MSNFDYAGPMTEADYKSVLEHGCIERNGKKVKGKSMAASEEAVRADLRRQGVVPSRIRKQSPGLFKGSAKVTPGDIANVF